MLCPNFKNICFENIYSWSNVFGKFVLIVSCLHKIHQSSLNDCWSKLLWHMLYNFLSYSFGYSQRWKLRLWSNTGDQQVWTFEVSLTSFQRSNIRWPQQPQTEIGARFNLIFHDFTEKHVFSKHQNKTEFNNLDYFKVLSGDFPGLKTSTASIASTASTASVASMTHFGDCGSSQLSSDSSL